MCANEDGDLLIDSAVRPVPKVFVVSTLVSIAPAQPFVFRNYQVLSNFSVQDVTFFHSFRHVFNQKNAVAYFLSYHDPSSLLKSDSSSHFCLQALAEVVRGLSINLVNRQKTENKHRLRSLISI